MLLIYCPEPASQNNEEQKQEPEPIVPPPFLIGKYFIGGVQWVTKLTTIKEFDQAWKATQKSAIGFQYLNGEYKEICRWNLGFVNVLPKIEKAMENKEYLSYCQGDQTYVKILEGMPGAGYAVSAFHASNGDADRARRAAASSVAPLGASPKVQRGGASQVAT